LLLAILVLLVHIPSATPQSASPAKGNLTKEELRRQKAVRNEFIDPYAEWLWFEVGDIVTAEEVSVFKRLTTDDERENFIAQFWERRNPEPGSLENKFKQNYYRRMISANERFSTSTPGWKTDRGRIYIKYGPPDEIESHPHGGIMHWSEENNGGEPTTKPFERWFYRGMEGIGPNQVLIFLDSTNAGDYRLAMLPSDEARLLHDPRRDREIPSGPVVSPEPFLKPTHPPAPAKFSDLRAVITSGQVSSHPIPFLVRTYAFPVINQTALAIIAVQLPASELHFQAKGEGKQARVDVYAQVEELDGRIAAEFERTELRDLPKNGIERGISEKFVFEDGVLLGAGRYKISLALKDEASGRMGSLWARLIVPDFHFRLCTSAPIILADSIEPRVLPKDELEPFVIGNSKVMPNPGQLFARQGDLHAYLQIYNLGLDPNTHKPDFSIKYEVLKDGKPVIEEPEEEARLAEASTEFTLTKTVPLKTLAPGGYTFQINIADKIAKQTISPATIFYVR
jgi:GWxTD domain-containing protein